MIANLKELERLLKICRKRGVTEITMEGISVKLGDLPQAPQPATDDPTDPYANFPQGELTPEQLAFYSSGGKPGDDPENMT